MYCGKCGKEIEDGTAFCPYCGENQVTDGSGSDMPGDGGSVDNEGAGQNSSDAGGRHSSLSNRAKWLIVAAAVVVVAVVVIIIVASNSRVTIDMNKYLVVSESGYNGYGSVGCHVDVEKMEADYGGKLKLTSEGNSNVLFASAIAQGEDPVDLIYYDLDAYPDISSGLSNGDKVTFTWDDSNVSMLETYIRVSIKTKDYVYTVSGLEEVESEDFFNNVSVDFSGIAPDGTVNLHVDGDCDWLSVSDFSLSKSDGLSNGDTVTVSINEYALENIMNEYGKAPIETEREYTVEGVGEYITSLSQISSEDLEKMDEIARQELYAKAEDAEDTLNEINLLGYELVEPNSRHESDVNEIYAVYKINETLDWSDPKYTLDKYWYISFADGYINSNGDFSIDYNNYFVPIVDSYDWWSGYVKEGEGYTYEVDGEGIANVEGFETLEDLNNAIGANGSDLLDSTVQGG